MGEVEEEFWEPAVLWLAQTIVLNSKLKTWIRLVGLADDIERLKSEVERVEMVVAAVKGRAIWNKPLARAIGRLKELLYDADDMLDELDYYRLQQQVEGVTTFTCPDEPEDTSGDGSDQVDVSRDNNGDLPSRIGKRRSEYWKEYTVVEHDNGKPSKARCIHCNMDIRCDSKNGTSVLKKHLESEGCRAKREQRKAASGQQPNPPSVSNGISIHTTVGINNSVCGKRMRTYEESTCSITANAHTWDKAEISYRIQQISLQLQEIQGTVSSFLNFSVTSLSDHGSTTSDSCQRTSCLIQSKLYGRSAEKESIIKLMEAHKSGTTIVLPIVGVAGVGKTALAQFAYNYCDPEKENQFDYRMWVCVSNSSDEVRLTREMLDFVSTERHEGIISLSKLQEMLKGCLKSKRFVLVLDDVWDNMDDCSWNNLLAPFNSECENANGGLIVVTTRSLALAKMVGTIEPIKLVSLENKDFWLLFKACAFGDENYDEHGSLSIIGRQIADKLKGNPLAAKTVGKLLRQNFTFEHWTNFLLNEDWKPLQLSGCITPALKLSFNRLPYHLHQCFCFCSIFPNNYQFTGEDLVRIWISLGFVKCSHSNKRLEDIGWDYLTCLVNLGFFEKVKKNDFTPGNQECYVMCGIMYDFARLVSRTECASATIDGIEFNEMPPTLRHLSILTDSAYSMDRLGNKLCDKRFKEKMQSVVASVRKLRTLVVIGKCDSFLFQIFKDIFQKAQCLRLLTISSTNADSVSTVCNLVNYIHLRYIKFEVKEYNGGLPRALNKFYHLQVLDFGHSPIPNAAGMNGLVSLRYLVVKKEAHFMITQLQFMSELVQLALYQLENFNEAEAHRVKLKDKQDLERLQLSWEDANNSPSFEHFADTSSVLEGLEPCHRLKHLQISGYRSATFPTWFPTSVPSLQTLHLENCTEWRILPSLEMLPFLRKLKLRNMQKVEQVSIPSLEKLVLINMPKLKRCSCSSVRNLNSSLRVLKIEKCHVLECRDLTSNGVKEMFAGFTSLKKLKIVESTSLLLSFLRKDEEDGHADGRLLLPQSLGKLSITGSLKQLRPCFPGVLTWLKILELTNCQELEYLQLHSCTTLEDLIIKECQFLTQLVGLQFISKLRYLQVLVCNGLPPCLEDLSVQGYELCPRLERLKIDDLRILTTSFCKHLTSLQYLELCTREKEVTRLTDKQERALQLLTSLQELQFRDCQSLVDLPAGLHSLPSLRRLEIDSCLTISGLPGKGLPPSLEDLEISRCSQVLTDQCRMLATWKLRVKIDGEYVPLLSKVGVSKGKIVFH